MPDTDEIKAACFELLDRESPRHPDDLARRIGIPTALLIGTLGDDYRFVRIAGERCWHWGLREPRTRAARKAHEATVKAEKKRDHETAVAINAQRFQWRERIREVIAQHSGGCTTRRIAEITRLQPAEVEEGLRDLVKLGEITAVTIAYMAEFGPFWKAA